MLYKIKYGQNCLMVCTNWKVTQSKWNSYSPIQFSKLEGCALSDKQVEKNVGA